MNRTLLFPRKMREPHPRTSFAIDNQLYQRVEEKVLRDRITGEFKLSPRENYIAFYLAKGYKPREIADMLSISEETVITHRKNIYEKLGVHNQQHMISWLVLAIFKVGVL